MTKLEKLALWTPSSHAITKATKTPPGSLKEMGKYLAFPAALAGTAALISYGIIPGIGAIKNKMAKEKAWKKIVARNPEFADNEELKEEFDALYALSPSSMKYPPLATPALRQSASIQGGGVPLHIAQSIANIEHQRRDAGSKLKAIEQALNVGTRLQGQGIGSIQEKEQWDYS